MEEEGRNVVRQLVRIWCGEGGGGSRQQCLCVVTYYETVYTRVVVGGGFVRGWTKKSWLGTTTLKALRKGRNYSIANDYSVFTTV